MTLTEIGDVRNTSVVQSNEDVVSPTRPEGMPLSDMRVSIDEPVPILKRPAAPQPEEPAKPPQPAPVENKPQPDKPQ